MWYSSSIRVVFYVGKNYRFKIDTAASCLVKWYHHIYLNPLATFLLYLTLQHNFYFALTGLRCTSLFTQGAAPGYDISPFPGFFLVALCETDKTQSKIHNGMRYK